jgi:hypothetical protein
LKGKSIQVKNKTIMAKTRPRIMGFTWAPSLINKVVIRHKWQIKSMQTQIMSLLSMNMASCYNIELIFQSH